VRGARNRKGWHMSAHLWPGSGNIEPSTTHTLGGWIMWSDDDGWHGFFCTVKPTYNGICWPRRSPF
jgi:hypothetical protein